MCRHRGGQFFFVDLGYILLEFLFFWLFRAIQFFILLKWFYDLLWDREC